MLQLTFHPFNAPTTGDPRVFSISQASELGLALPLEGYRPAGVNGDLAREPLLSATCTRLLAILPEAFVMQRACFHQADDGRQTDAKNHGPCLDLRDRRSGNTLALPLYRRVGDLPGGQEHYVFDKPRSQNDVAPAGTVGLVFPDVPGRRGAGRYGPDVPGSAGTKSKYFQKPNFPVPAMKRNARQ